MSSTSSSTASRPYVVDGKTDAERYLEKVNDGTIVSSKWMRKLSDMVLPRFHEEHNGFHFDQDEALRPVRFIERYLPIVEGELAGKPFVLHPFQRNAIELAYGFVNEDGKRQYQQVLMEMARKCGKTATMSALDIFHLLADREPGAEVYNCATSDSQARKCYGSAARMCEMSPFLKKRVRRGMAQKTGKSALNYDKNGSMLVAISGKASTKDGMSASAVIYDELAAVQDNGALFDQLTESMQARRNPILWIISSENYIRDGIWDSMLDLCHKVLDGEVEDDSILPLLYVQDDRSEIKVGLEQYDRGEFPSMWLKSNPGLGVIKDTDKLAARVRRMEASPRTVPSVITKDFCLRSGSYSSFLDVNVCINKTPIDFGEMGIPPYVCCGFDLAARNDLCAFVCRWRVPGDDRIYEIAKFWVASDVINMQADANQKDRVPYLLWSSQGQAMDDTVWHYVDIVDGDRVNQSVIIDMLNDLVSVGMYPYSVAYDGWHVDDTTDRTIRRLCGDQRCFQVPQTARVLSPLMRTYELDLNARKVICPNPCLHHSRQSLEAREDNGGNLFPRKKDLQPHAKIDGAMSEMFAMYAEQKVYDEYMSAIGWEPPS